MSEPTAAPEGDVVAEAAAERRDLPTTEVEAADLADRYETMLRLADLFDDVGAEMRERAKLGATIVADEAFADSAPLSPGTHARAEDDVRAATTGRHGLLTRSIELDADALVLRATVLTYRWIDELQAAAYQTLGAIAGRAIGYLAPQVALGGAIVSAGLIETDALDRDGVAAYLNELAESNPELMEHVTSGGGGLLDALAMRAVLTAGVLAGETGRRAARGGRRAAGIPTLPTDFSAALRDVAGGVVQDDAERAEAAEADVVDPTSPAGLSALISTLESCKRPVTVTRVAPGRFVAYLTGPGTTPGERRLRLVGGDHTSYVAEVAHAIERAVGEEQGASVMVVGTGAGGVAAVQIAAGDVEVSFTVDQVVTAGSPSAHVPRVPSRTRVLSLEDRSDPVAVLGSLVNADAPNRLTVVFDGSEVEVGAGQSVYVAGGRAADDATHPELRSELGRLRELGYLAG